MSKIFPESSTNFPFESKLNSPFLVYLSVPSFDITLKYPSPSIPISVFIPVSFNAPWVKFLVALDNFTPVPVIKLSPLCGYDCLDKVSVYKSRKPESSFL